MSVFIVRHQGFFYTDEYFAPTGAYRQNLRQVFETREEAEEASRAQSRAWIRQSRIDDYVFAYADAAAAKAVTAYLRETWPGDYWDLHTRDFRDIRVPDYATDGQIDVLLQLANIELAKVFEVEVEDAPPDPDEASDFHFGPPR